jgi:hypothetical protein
MLRITLVLVAFLTVVTGFFLNKIGLPDFVKDRLVRQLRAKGWDVEFSRIRLRWYRGIVADDVHLRRTNTVNGPNLFVSRAECGLNFTAFTQLKLDVKSFKMNDARLIWPATRSGRSQPAFTLNHLAGELDVKRNDEWELRFLDGELLGAHVHFTGTATNGSLIRDWRFAEKRRGPRRDPVRAWEEIVRHAAAVRFAAQPEIEGTFRGDAADLRSFDGSIKLKAPALSSPWGAGTNFLLTARLFPGRPATELVQADFTVNAERVRTPWAEASEARLNLELEPRYTNAWPTNVNIALELKDAKTKWGQSDYALVTTRLRCSESNASSAQAELKAMIKGFQRPGLRFAQGDVKLFAIHPLTNWLPAAVSLSGDLSTVEAEDGKAAKMRIRFDGKLPETTNLSLLNTNLPWPDRIRSLPGQMTVDLADVKNPKVEAEKIAVTAVWNWPSLQLKADGALYGGAFKANAAVQTETRDLDFSAQSTFDVHKIEALLGTNTQNFLKSYSWDSPPSLNASGHLTLPPWTNRFPELDSTALSNVSLAGDFKVASGAYKGITFTAAEAPFNFTNNIWRIDPLTLQRPEGDLIGTYTSRPETKEFHWKLRSRVNPLAFKTLFGRTERQGFEFFEFTAPPVIEGEIWGHWRDLDRLGVKAKVRADNFKFRGENVAQASAEVIYTNLFLAFINPEIQRPAEKGVAPGIAVDFAGQRVWFTNAFGNLNPQVVARSIGRFVGEIMKEYIFDKPPMVRVNGFVDFKKGSDEDNLHFEISGDAFHWKDFRFQQIAGNIDWVGRSMTITNVQGIFHGGRTAGHAYFEFPRKKGADFSFKLSAAEVNFHSFMSDLRGKTNKLEGMLSGELTVVAGNTGQANSWMGYGNVHLRDGLIWDFPVFGIFSPILNAIVPGVGNSRAKTGSGEFLITNSVISTKDLDIQATAMRMHFQGTLDFEKRLDSRVEAELLRDLPGIGVVISKILWPVTKLFEYRVTNTLMDPKTEPLYMVPKILLLPFQPFKVIKDAVTEPAKPAPPKTAEQNQTAPGTTPDSKTPQ